MTNRHAALLAAALVLVSTGPLRAQTASAPVPVDISANEMEILDAEKKAVFRGAVDATRGTTNLKADALTVTYAEVKQPDGSSKTDATDLDARGNVIIKTPGETITGDWARFDPPANQLVVGGGMKLVRGDTVLTGNELRADLNTDMSDAKGNVTIKTPRETITGDWAKFDSKANKLVVGGAVKLVQGATVLSGSELRADLNTDKIQMTGGRVKGSFLPK
jgi:lipopolysaccharide export system protein LptA